MGIITSHCGLCQQAFGHLDFKQDNENECTDYKYSYTCYAILAFFINNDLLFRHVNSFVTSILQAMQVTILTS